MNTLSSLLLAEGPRGDTSILIGLQAQKCAQCIGHTPEMAAYVLTAAATVIQCQFEQERLLDTTTVHQASRAPRRAGGHAATSHLLARPSE